MTDASTYVEDEGVGRRELLKKTAIGGGLVVAALATPGLTGTAEAHGGKSIVLDVDTLGFKDFQAPADPAGLVGPFYVSGTIFAPGTSRNIGTFHCWGFLPVASVPPAATTAFDGVVNQEFDLTGRGKILIAGVESEVPRAVIGGTGHFRNARGEGKPDLTDFLATGKFRISFNLSGAKGRPIV